MSLSYDDKTPIRHTVYEFTQQNQREPTPADKLQFHRHSEHLYEHPLYALHETRKTNADSHSSLSRTRRQLHVHRQRFRAPPTRPEKTRSPQQRKPHENERLRVHGFTIPTPPQSHFSIDHEHRQKYQNRYHPHRINRRIPSAPTFTKCLADISPLVGSSATQRQFDYTHTPHDENNERRTRIGTHTTKTVSLSKHRTHGDSQNVSRTTRFTTTRTLDLRRT